MTEAEFLVVYGRRPDTAAKRKALSRGEVPEALVAPLQQAIEASGIPREQTAGGWVGDEVFAELHGVKRAKDVS
jgi:hypothetical protein